MKNLSDIIAKGSKILSLKGPHEKINSFFEFLGKNFHVDGAIIFVWMPGYHNIFKSHFIWCKREFKSSMDNLILSLYKDKSNVYLPIGQNSYADYVLEKNQYLYVKDVRTSKYWGDNVIASCGINSTLTYPIILEEHLKILTLFFSVEKNAFPDDFLIFLDKFLNKLKFVVRFLIAEDKSVISINLEKKLRQKNHELEILLKMARHLSFCSTYEDALLVLKKLMSSLIQYDFFVFVSVFQDVKKIYIYPYYTFGESTIEKIKHKVIERLKKYVSIEENNLEIYVDTPSCDIEKNWTDTKAIFWYPIESTDGGLDVGMFCIGRLSKNFKRHEVRFLNLICTQLTISFLKIKEFYERGRYILQNILYNFPLGVILFDSNYKISFFNRLGELYISRYGQITDDGELIFSSISMEKFVEYFKGEAEIQVGEGEEAKILNLILYPMKGFSSVLSWILFITDVTEQRQAQQKTFRMLEETVYSLALAIERRDPYTAGHQRNVAELSLKIGEKLGLGEDSLHWLYMGALLHDLGKISIPSEILTRPGKLTPEEFALIKTHPKVGYDILKDIEFIGPIKEMVLYHHERLDGSGYPMGLKGDEIPLEARILAVADVVDAISSHRPYRPALGIDVALGEIKKQRGIKYDERVVDACLSLDLSCFDFLKK